MSVVAIVVFKKTHVLPVAFVWPSCGLRRFSKWPSCGLRVAIDEGSEFQGPKVSSAVPRPPLPCLLPPLHLRQCARMRVQPWDAGFFPPNAQPFCSRGFVAQRLMSKILHHLSSCPLQPPYLILIAISARGVLFFLFLPVAAASSHQY